MSNLQYRSRTDGTECPDDDSTQQTQTWQPLAPIERDGVTIRPRRIKLTVAYDGTANCGWQDQPDRPSVQQTLEEVFASVVGHPVKIHGSGRTDRGVHARGQVAHLDVVTRVKNQSLIRAVNARLPPDIRVLRLVNARSDFHARRSAHGKEYRYIVWMGGTVLPDKRLYATHVYKTLNMEAMRSAASAFIGKHDFSAFTANPQREIETTVRTIFDFKITKKGPEVVFSVSGDGFLYKQVRSMVGFLLRVGEGAEKAETVKILLDTAAKRMARVPSAPPQGLFLWRVWYTGARGR